MSVATGTAALHSTRFSPASGVLAVELWISFAGLLRSHVAMRSITEPSANWQIVSNEPSSIDIRGWSSRLNITTPEGARTGSIEWPAEGDKKSERFATFSFTDDGRLFFDSPPAPAGPEAMEMETAAEFLLDALRERRRA